MHCFLFYFIPSISELLSNIFKHSLFKNFLIGAVIRNINYYSWSWSIIWIFPGKTHAAFWWYDNVTFIEQGFSECCSEFFWLCQFQPVLFSFCKVIVYRPIFCMICSTHNDTVHIKTFPVRQHFLFLDQILLNGVFLDFRMGHPFDFLIGQTIAHNADLCLHKSSCFKFLLSIIISLLFHMVFLYVAFVILVFFPFL